MPAVCRVSVRTLPSPSHYGFTRACTRAAQPESRPSRFAPSRSNGALYSYLYPCHLRRQSLCAPAASQRPPARDEDATAACDQLQPHQDVYTLELCRRIEEALATLSEDQRMAFVLREYERLGYGEIASITGVHEGVVKSRLARAKASLSQQLRPYLEADA